MRVSGLELERGEGGVGVVHRPPGPPDETRLHERGFTLGEIGDKKAEWQVVPRAFVYARRTRSSSSSDVSFQYRPSKPAAQDDYYYLRVVQLDGEAAWTSPVWIGEAKSPKKTPR